MNNLKEGLAKLRASLYARDVQINLPGALFTKQSVKPVPP